MRGAVLSDFLSVLTVPASVGSMPEGHAMATGCQVRRSCIKLSADADHCRNRFQNAENPNEGSERRVEHPGKDGLGVAVCIAALMYPTNEAPSGISFASVGP